MLEKIAIAGVSAVFAAGVAWGISRAQLDQLRKDVNGIGRKMNRLKDAQLVFCSESQRKELAEFLRS